MQGLDYVAPAEIASLPVLQQSPDHIVYMPMAECSREPDCVLLFLNAAQSLVMTEAIARVDGKPPAALGRPACAVVPFVVNSKQSAVSLGCCGARAYLDNLDDATSLWALEGSKMEAYGDSIETFSKANATLAAFHQRRREEIAAGMQPRVMETFNAMSD